jgi:hypothetical protein
MELHPLTFASFDRPPLSPDDPLTVVWRGKDNKPDVIAKRIDGWCWFRVVDLASYRFPAESPDLHVTCMAEPEEGAGHEAVTDGYYRYVVPLALQVYGLEAMHGTAVETPAGAVALCGRSHAGKTTLTYALFRSGYRVLADDGLVVDPTGADGSPAVQPIPFALMIREGSAEHFGTAVRERVHVAGEGPVLTVPPVPLAAVVLVNRVEGATVALEPLAKAEAYTSLLGRSYVFSFDDPVRKRALVSAYARFANTVPVYRLTYPDGLDAIDTAVSAIEGLVESLGGS